MYGSDAMIPVEIHKSSPRFQSFVVEDSTSESGSVGRDQGGGEDQGRGVKKKSGAPVQFQGKASAVPR